MNRLIVLLVPFAMLACRWEVRDACDDDWHAGDDYYESFDVREADAREDGMRDVGSEERAPRDSASADADSGMPNMESDVPSCVDHADCETASYCEPESAMCVPAASCAQESDCDAGFNCEEELCLPADEERCSELAEEQLCSERNDCEATYAGVDCSCGAECTCMGGEPGCVCESFEFFACVEVPD